MHLKYVVVALLLTAVVGAIIAGIRFFSNPDNYR